MPRSNPIQESYDRLAADYDRRWQAYEQATLLATLEVIPSKPGERILDVACGTGQLERLLLPRLPDG